jgi:hypothetical protein
MIAFRASQFGNHSGVGQSSWRGEDDRVFVFIIPEVFEADRLCSFHCHGIIVVCLSLCWQGRD